MFESLAYRPNTALQSTFVKMATVHFEQGNAVQTVDLPASFARMGTDCFFYIYIYVTTQRNNRPLNTSSVLVRCDSLFPCFNSTTESSSCKTTLKLKLSFCFVFEYDKGEDNTH